MQILIPNDHLTPDQPSFHQPFISHLDAPTGVVVKLMDRCFACTAAGVCTKREAFESTSLNLTLRTTRDF